MRKKEGVCVVVGVYDCVGVCVCIKMKFSVFVVTVPGLLALCRVRNRVT